MKVFIFDTETTGLISNSMLPPEKQPFVIEFYGGLWEAVPEEAPELFREVEFFAKPPVEIEEVITRITGITPEMLEGEKPFRDNLEAVLGIIAEADEVVAHNLSYDMAITNLEAVREGATISWPKVQTCTVEATEHLKGHRLNLSGLHEYLFGEPFAGAHRAKVDVEALAQCYFELVRRGEI